MLQYGFYKTGVWIKKHWFTILAATYSVWME